MDPHLKAATLVLDNPHLPALAALIPALLQPNRQAQLVLLAPTLALPSLLQAAHTRLQLVSLTP
jgi:hypothetical protein